MYVFWEYVNIWVCPHRGQKKVLGPLEMKLEAVVSYPGWVLGTQFRSSAGALFVF